MRTLMLLLLIVLLPSHASAADFSYLYSDSVLRERHAKYVPNIRWNFDNLILGSLTPAERAKVGHVKLAFPLHAGGSMRGQPLAFYAGGHTITVPILSVKFFDDLTVAWGYFWANELSMEYVTDYLGMLKYKSPASIGGRFPPPFQALGVAPDAWKQNARVDDVSQKAMKSALVWILAHELAHIYYEHPGYGPHISRVQAQHNEVEADRFANTIMRRIGVAPMGMAQFFMMMAHFDTTRADFNSDQAWEKYLNERATHPLTGERMQAMAEDLLRSPGDFASEQSSRTAAAEVVRYVAQQIQGIGIFLNDYDIQHSIAIKARATDLVSLKRWQKRAGNKPTSTAFNGTYSGNYIRYFPNNQSESLVAEMQLRRQGNRVNGRFWFGLGEGTIEGIIRNSQLTYEWSWSTLFGRGKLITDPNTGQIRGNWGYQTATEGGGAWQLEPK